VWSQWFDNEARVGGIREGKWQFPKLSELHMLAAAALVVVVVVATPICSCSSLLSLSLCFVIFPCSMVSSPSS